MSMRIFVFLAAAFSLCKTNSNGGCHIESTGYYYTDTPAVWALSFSACAAHNSTTVQVHNQTNSAADLHNWLFYRHGLQTCVLGRAFASEFVSSASPAYFRPCIIAPTGIECMEPDQLDNTLELPVLCYTLGSF